MQHSITTGVLGVSPIGNYDVRRTNNFPELSANTLTGTPYENSGSAVGPGGLTYVNVHDRYVGMLVLPFHLSSLGRSWYTVSGSILGQNMATTQSIYARDRGMTNTATATNLNGCFYINDLNEIHEHCHSPGKGAFAWESKQIDWARSSGWFGSEM